MDPKTHIEADRPPDIPFLDKPMLILRRRLGNGSWVRFRHKSGDTMWIGVNRGDNGSDQVSMVVDDPRKNFEIARKEVLTKLAGQAVETKDATG